MSLPTLLVPGNTRARGATAGETPLAYVQRWVRRHMPEFGGHTAALADRVLIVKAKTGSGKSTVLPVGLFRLLRSEQEPSRVKFHGPGVICTQPRVLTAVSLAEDVSDKGRPGPKRYRDMVLGETVGYQTGPVSNRPPTGLIYATAGVLAAQLRQQEDAEIMGRYRFIIVDEAHERSLESDMTLMLLRNFYRRNIGNPRLPFLLLTSATFEPARYADYFSVSAENIVEVEGRAFEIHPHWPTRGTNNYWAEAVATAVRIHEENPDDPPERADILIFVPGTRAATAISRGLAAANMKYIEHLKGPSPGPMLILQLNRDIVNSQTGDYSLAFEDPSRLPAVGGRRPRRRVIIATSVAETGVTLAQLRYVIDGGWSRTQEVYQPWGVEGLVTRPAPQSRIEQRKGRAGRLFPGDFYPLYTKNVFEALDQQQLPDIYTTGPATIHLATIQEQQRQKLRIGQEPEFRVEDMSLLDPPAPEAFLAANAVASALGFVSVRALLPDRWPPALERQSAEQAHGYGLTALGHLAAGFMRTPMEGARILLAGYVWDAAASDLATLVALLGGSRLWSWAARAAPGDLPAGAAALRAALPPYLVGRTGGGAPLPPGESEMFYFRARLLLADDMLEALLIYDAFVRQVEGAQEDLGTVSQWCESVGLDFDALVELSRRRETIQEEMILNGLNPFRENARRLSTQPIETFMACVSRLKRCLYDGLRGQLLQYAPNHAEGPGYLTRQGLHVRVPELFSDALAARLRALHVTSEFVTPPRWILTDQVKLVSVATPEKDRLPPILFRVEANFVSVLDGYVDIDPDFESARTFSDPRPSSHIPPS